MDNKTLVDLVRENRSYLALKAPRNERVLAAMKQVDRKAFLPELEYHLTAVDGDAASKLASALDAMGDALRDGRPVEQATAESVLNNAYETASSRTRITVSVLHLAYTDIPLKIGHDQTCSQPSMVAFMCDVLDLHPGMRVLEIGTGCGYHAAVTTELVGESGHLYTVECIPELADMARKNLRKQFGDDYGQRVTVVDGDGSPGLPNHAPFDRIYLTAGVSGRGFDAGILSQQLAPGGILLYPEQEGSMFRETYGRFGNIVDLQRYDGVCFVPLRSENGTANDAFSLFEIGAA